MADGMEIDLDLRTLTVPLELHGLAAVRKASELVRATSLGVVADAQQTVNVDTGATKNSIHASAEGGAPMASGTLSTEMGPTTSYAPFIHDGTSRIPPNPFMDNALERRTPGFLEGVAQIPDLL